MWEDRGKTLEEEIGKREEERGKWVRREEEASQTLHNNCCTIIVAQLVHNSVSIASSWETESN